MRISVLIPSLNEAPAIAAAVRSAVAIGSAEAQVAEVIVADGGSDDATAELATEAGASVVHTQRGRGRQLAAAAEASTGDVLLMLHADSRLPRDAGRQIATALRDPRVACGAFRQRIDAAGWRYRWIERGNALRARRLGLPYGDQAIFLRRELLDAVGGVPALPLMEDVELMQRIARRRRPLGVCGPVLLEGPVTTSARRWRQSGVVRQTLRNWTLLAAFTAGVPAHRLARHYAPHAGDQSDPASVT